MIDWGRSPQEAIESPKWHVPPDGAEICRRRPPAAGHLLRPAPARPCADRRRPLVRVLRQSDHCARPGHRRTARRLRPPRRRPGAGVLNHPKRRVVMFRFLFFALVLIVPSRVFAQVPPPRLSLRRRGGAISPPFPPCSRRARISTPATRTATRRWPGRNCPATRRRLRRGTRKKTVSRSTIIGTMVWSHPLERGFPDVVALLINRGADVNAKDSHYGRTPLIWAARNLQLGLVKTLLDKGADRALQDKEGQTALSATPEMAPEIVKLLIELDGVRARHQCCGQIGSDTADICGHLNDVPHLQS